MTINDPKKFCAGLWDWAILDGCFGETNIKPMDIDGFVERKGKKLYFETKAPGASIPKGEQISYDSLVRDGSTVIFIWGTTNKPEKIKVVTPNAIKIYENATVNILRDVVSKWFAWANQTH